MSGFVAKIVRMRRKITEEEAASVLGRLGGLKGGKSRMAKLSKEEKTALGKKAAEARWGKHRVRQAGAI